MWFRTPDNEVINLNLAESVRLEPKGKDFILVATFPSEKKVHPLTEGMDKAEAVFLLGRIAKRLRACSAEELISERSY